MQSSVTARILGTGHALPSNRLTNFDLEKRVDTSNEWIVERTGIHERRILEEGLGASFLATQAARAACENAGINPATLDCIIVATVTPDQPLPSTASMVQKNLGCGPAPAFDLAAACAGFVYGLSVAESFVKTGKFKRVCVVGVEILSRILDWNDRNTCVLFGDGAGAVIVGADRVSAAGPEAEIVSTHLFADGEGAEHLYIPAGGSLRPTSAETVAQNLHTVRMNGRQVFATAVRNLSSSCETALSANGLSIPDIAWVVAHQANLRIVEGVADRLQIPMDRFFINIEKYGNTSSASVPIALDEMNRAGLLKSGDRLLLCALGAGFSWGSALLRW